MVMTLPGEHGVKLPWGSTTVTYCDNRSFWDLQQVATLSCGWSPHTKQGLSFKISRCPSKSSPEATEESFKKSYSKNLHRTKGENCWVRRAKNDSPLSTLRRAVRGVHFRSPLKPSPWLKVPFILTANKQKFTQFQLAHKLACQLMSKPNDEHTFSCLCLRRGVNKSNKRPVSQSNFHCWKQ